MNHTDYLELVGISDEALIDLLEKTGDAKCVIAAERIKHLRQAVANITELMETFYDNFCGLSSDLDDLKTELDELV